MLRRLVSSKDYFKEDPEMIDGIEIVIPTLGDDADVTVDGYSIKNLINIIIEFINKLIKFEF